MPPAGRDDPMPPQLRSRSDSVSSAKSRDRRLSVASIPEAEELEAFDDEMDVRLSRQNSASPHAIRSHSRPSSGHSGELGSLPSPPRALHPAHPQQHHLPPANEEDEDEAAAHARGAAGLAGGQEPTALGQAMDSDEEEDREAMLRAHVHEDDGAL
jgi:hypothetical protein